MRKKYYICYSYWKDDGIFHEDGIGNAIITEDDNIKDIYTEKALQTIRDTIAKEHNWSGVAFLNIIPLNG